MPAASLVIRQGTPVDADILTDFSLALGSEVEGIALDRGLVLRGVKAVLEDSAKGFYLVVEADGSPIGGLAISYEWSTWRAATFWWIQDVYVEPPWRRKGVYRTLYNHLHRMGRSRGDIGGIRLYVDQNNLVAKEAYVKLGMAKAHYDMF